MIPHIFNVVHLEHRYLTFSTPYDKDKPFKDQAFKVREAISNGLTIETADGGLFTINLPKKIIAIEQRMMVQR